jgi:hypothetical protein
VKGKQLIVGIAAVGAVLLTAGAGVAASPSETVAPKARANAEPKADRGCQATANSFENNGYVYLYGRSYCKGSHDAKDDGNDSDYRDVKDNVQNFDNEVDSIINKHKTKSVKFYNYPNYNKGHEAEGDTFCVRPGHYVRRLYIYGDGGGNNNWWSNSISSHEFVDPGDCDRWFGWLVED